MIEQTAFRSIADPPYLPPTRTTADLLLTLFPRAPNPHLTQLADEADRLLPSAPLGSGIIHDPTTRSATVTSWRRHLTRHPPGHPDGTGLRGGLLLACANSFALTAQCGWTPSYTPATPQPIVVSSPPRH